ncbi:DUF4388 domain-containing protein [Streptomyces ortus]|uniref:PatA-like N-terminal domain-containing protein n=1 Tax=Streptomyces ortus TaxID=2867268 RepID=A0ABT3V2X2_9ACTN|nr:hypothetical protein [Streptomyces ortus]MCX4234352.1 hypothetical protein [Streptomyces ortus]
MTTTEARNLPALLQGLHEEGYGGTVRVSGSPGGTIHLRDGLIVAVETPGAPSATSVLLTPGRVDDETWLAACAAEPDTDRLGGYLVSAGLIGAAELEVVCTAAVFDAAFAMAIGPPGGWTLDGPEPALHAGAGVEPRRLTEETTRRIVRLSGPWGAPGELARIRPAAVPDAGLRRGLPDRHRAVLSTVNGRRTARDMAFTLGRGLFAIMLDLTRLEAQDLIRWETGGPAEGRPSTAPRVLPGRGASDAPVPGPPRAEPAANPAPLPRRTRGAGAWPGEPRAGEDRSRDGRAHETQPHEVQPHEVQPYETRPHEAQAHGAPVREGKDLVRDGQARESPPGEAPAGGSDALTAGTTGGHGG